MQKKKSRFNIRVRLVLLAVVPVFLVATVIIFGARYSLIDGLYSESLDGLTFLAEATKSGYDSYPGDYYMDDKGNLWKGETNLTEVGDEIDRYTEGYKTDVTIFYGKTRKLTSLVSRETGKKIIGTQADDEVWNHVKSGKVYKTTDIVINGLDYSAVYIPLKNSDGSIVGMVFAGEPIVEIDTYINKKVITLTYSSVLSLLFAAVLGLIVANSIAKYVVFTSKTLSQLAGGDLNATVSDKLMKRSDEIGEMGLSTKHLTDKLRNIVTQLRHVTAQVYETGNDLDSMAEQTNHAAEDISCAVDDISKGAVSQAEEIQTASAEISNIGAMIEGIVGNVEKLTRIADDMGNAGQQSTSIIKELEVSSIRTSEAVKNISDQINATNEAVKKISDAASLITEITNQTSLLALNASIEAARAGEAGRGFGVVATEINNLATQSDEAAKEIQEILSVLQEESQKTLSAMETTESLVKEQQRKLSDTIHSFESVTEGINISRDETSTIMTNVEACNNARIHINDVINNLSAISEENAASSEETTASMQELNATINVLAEKARGLKDISEGLNETMYFFKM